MSLERATRLHHENVVFDAHNELPSKLRRLFDNDLSAVDLSQDQSSQLDTDIPRLREGGVGAVFFSAWAPCLLTPNASDIAREQMDVIHEMAERWSDDFELVTSPDGVRQAFLQGKISSAIGVEGGHLIDSSLDTLHDFYDLGARYLTLTHVCDTPLATSHMSLRPSTGLTEFGEEVVLEMNKMGMLVDLSHTSNSTMHDTLRVTTAPVLFSHSCTRKLCNLNRNIPDEVLAQLPDNGGVAMVNFGSHLSCSLRSTIAKVADHIDHIVQVAGIDHVGYGSDFDAAPLLPRGLQDVSGFVRLTAELLDRGYSDEDAVKVMGGNFMRAWYAVEAEAARLQA